MSYSSQNAPGVRRALAKATEPAADWCDRLYRDGEKRAAREVPKNQGFGEGNRVCEELAPPSFAYSPPARSPGKQQRDTPPCASPVHERLFRDNEKRSERQREAEMRKAEQQYEEAHELHESRRKVVKEFRGTGEGPAIYDRLFHESEQNLRKRRMLEEQQKAAAAEAQKETAKRFEHDPAGPPVHERLYADVQRGGLMQ